MIDSSGWDGKAFDRWLTGEPSETCLHEGTPCIGIACECDCSRCEEYKMNFGFDPSEQYTQHGKPFPVITLCGSMRYYELMINAAEALTESGWIVLSPFVARYIGGVPADETKRMLDAMHFAKIDLSRAILVIGEHRGESTLHEIEYAQTTGKIVFVSVTDAITFVKGHA